MKANYPIIPYYTLDQSSFCYSLLNKQNSELIIRIHVFNYHSETNYPMYLDKPYYYIYSYSLLYHKDGYFIKEEDRVYGGDRIIMGVSDIRISVTNEEELLQMIKDKLLNDKRKD